MTWFTLFVQKSRTLLTLEGCVVVVSPCRRMRERWRRRLRDVWPLHVPCPRVFNGKPLLLSTWITPPHFLGVPHKVGGGNPHLAAFNWAVRTVSHDRPGIYQTHWILETREREEKREKASYLKVVPGRSAGPLGFCFENQQVGYSHTQTKWPSNNWTRKKNYMRWPAK